MPETPPYFGWGDRGPYTTVPFSQEEMQELIWLIDDEPVDEEELRVIRRKLKKYQKNLRKAIRQHADTRPDLGGQDASHEERTTH